ncbi:uncharacterized protein G2W53_044057 [Senna tora]|uniref:Uncharacterized protein n=1 Tax=Senna tora TaxID=362788 RepID=A0A834SJW8_9FABA|nr:uncharacterized protein G2W53_044057 [Senna tora]
MSISFLTRTPVDKSHYGKRDEPSEENGFPSSANCMQNANAPMQVAH